MSLIEAYLMYDVEIYLIYAWYILVYTWYKWKQIWHIEIYPICNMYQNIPDIWKYNRYVLKYIWYILKYTWYILKHTSYTLKYTWYMPRWWWPEEWSTGGGRGCSCTTENSKYHNIVIIIIIMTIIFSIAFIMINAFADSRMIIWEGLTLKKVTVLTDSVVLVGSGKGRHWWI